MKLRHAVLAACAGLALAAGCTRTEESQRNTEAADPVSRGGAQTGEPVTGGRIVGRSGEIEGREKVPTGMEVQVGGGTGGAGVTETHSSGMAGTGCEEGANAHGGGSLRSNAVHCGDEKARAPAPEPPETK